MANKYYAIGFRGSHDQAYSLMRVEADDVDEAADIAECSFDTLACVLDRAEAKELVKLVNLDDIDEAFDVVENGQAENGEIERIC